MLDLEKNKLRMKIEAVEKGNVELNDFELASINDQLIEAANPGLEHARTAGLLQAEVDKLRASNRLVHKKLESIRLHFKELKSILMSSR